MQVIAVLGEHWGVYKRGFNGLMYIVFKICIKKINDHMFNYGKNELYPLLQWNPKSRLILKGELLKNFFFIIN